MAIEGGDILRFAARQKYGPADEVVNVYHFEVGDDGTETDAAIINGVIATIDAAYVTIESYLPTGLEPNVYDVYNVTQDAPLGQHPWTGGYSGGTATGEVLPSTVAALIILPTAVKRMQGRVYLGPLSEASQNDSVLVSGAQTALTNFGDGLLTEWVGSNAGLAYYVVYSRTQGIAVRPNSFRVSALLASMRSRRLGRGS